VLLGAASASGQAPESASLTYARGPGAEGCPDEAAIRSSVSARLGYDPFRAGAERRISATITRTGKVLRAEVELRDATGKVTGSRRISSTKNDCSELAAAMSLAMSIAIDPQSQTRPAPAPAPLPPPAPAPPPVENPTPELVPPAPPELEPAPAPPSPARALDRAAPWSSPGPALRHYPPESPPSSDSIQVRLSAGGVASLGTEPGLALGVIVHAGIRWRAASIGLEGRADLPTSADADQGGRVTASLQLASLVPCGHWRVLVVCALGSVGALRGEGSGVDVPKEDTTLFGALGVRGGVEIPVTGPLSARIYGDLNATLTPTSLELGGETVWESPPVHGAVGLAAQVSFP
jgi:hypothetical protein